MKRAHAWLQDRGPTEEEQRWRAENFDILIGRPNIPVHREVNPDVEIYDYLGFKWDNWTKYLFQIGGGDPIQYDNFNVDDDGFRSFLVKGVVKRLDMLAGANGIHIDIPMETGDNWRAIQLCAEMRKAVAPRELMVNFGSWDAWMALSGDKFAWEALVAVCDYHHVEVFVDMAKTQNIPLVRFGYLGAMFQQNKKVIVGFYDANGTHADKVAKLVAQLTDPRVSVAYKTARGWEEISGVVP